MAWRRLTKTQRDVICIHLHQPKVSTRGGRPGVDDRRCLEGILWILWTGAPWSELPPPIRQPQYQLSPAHRVGRVTHQDGRKPRRYRRRWIGESSHL
jgi:transposase